MINFLFFFIVLLFVVFIVDLIIINEWEKKMTKSINNIFDGLKVFFVVHILDRFTNALSDDPEEEEEEDSEEIS